MAVSYYKIIDGKRYDRQMLKVVEDAVKRNENNLIVLDSAKKLFKVIIDGNRITAIERETLEYINEKFNFEDAAEKWLTRQIEAWDNKKNKKKLFSLSSLKLLRSDPIIAPPKTVKKPKKKSRLKPPKRKVTVNLKSIGKAPKPTPVVQKEPDQKQSQQKMPPVTAEELQEITPAVETKATTAQETPSKSSQTSKVPAPDKKSSENEQIAEFTQAKPAEDPQNVSAPVSDEKISENKQGAELTQSKPAEDLQNGSESVPVEKSPDQEKIPGELNTPKEELPEEETIVNAVEKSPEEEVLTPETEPESSEDETEVETEPEFPEESTRVLESERKPQEQPKPVSSPDSFVSIKGSEQAGGSNLWKWFAIACLLLIPLSFFVGRGFEPIGFDVKDESKLEELEAKVQAQNQEIVLLKTEKKVLQTDLEDTTAVAQEASSPQEVKKAVTKRKISTALTDQLSEEFSSNLIQFDKERLWLTFLPSESYFNAGSSTLNPSLKRALQKFFPNFVETLLNFEEDISEIRFQGHSSSVWQNAKNKSEAYLNNLRLSNARAESALRYCLGLKEVSKHKAWLEKRMVSSGFSDQKPVLGDNNTEDPIKSRRITISVGVTGPKN